MNTAVQVSRNTVNPSAQIPSSDAHNASELIAQVTTPQGVNTQMLGQWVAEASLHDPQAASSAYAEMEQKLLTEHGPGALGRFQQDVVRASQSPASQPVSPSGLATGISVGVGQGLVRHGDDIMRQNPILQKRWEFTESAWTNKGGPSGPLAALLERSGIQVAPGVNAPPPGSLNRNAAGINPQTANNINGDLGRDAIADRFRAQGLNVETEVSRLDGRRRVDVVVTQPARDPRFSTVLEIESKVGRASASSFHVNQVVMDVESLANNRAVRDSGATLGRVGRVVRPLGLVLDAVNVGAAFKADGNKVGENTGRAVSGLAGGAGGAWAGAAAGAALGSVVPGHCDRWRGRRHHWGFSR